MVYFYNSNLTFYLLFYAGAWEQWDTIIFPNEKEHGVRVAQGVGWSRLNIVSQFQKVSEDSEDTNRQNIIDPENEELVVARCHGVYLHSFKIKLQSCDIVSASFMFCNVEQIFNQLKHRLIGYDSSRASDSNCYTNKDWSSQKLNSVCISNLYTIHRVHNISHRLWSFGQWVLSVFYQQSLMSVLMQDILMDHVLYLPLLFCAFCSALLLLLSSL